MNIERTPETDRWYEQGVACMRAARWEEAIAALSQVRALSRAYPDVEALIADAQLKLEIEQAGVPPASAPPRSRLPRAALIGGLTTLTLIIAAVVVTLIVRVDPSSVGSAAQPIMLSIGFPTIAPTRTPTPAPTSTPVPALPTATLASSVIPPGTLEVRMASGEQSPGATPNLAIILDASGSMLARIDGAPKTVIARQALIALVERLPETTNVALRTYGHRRANDCSDTELVQAPAPLRRADLIDRISAIRPVNGGRTPIAQSLDDMARDLAGVDGEVLIVLVSDGDETCGGDPVATAAALHTANPRLRVSVIGFNIEQEEWRQRLEDIAESGGGAYFDAANAAQLADALEQAVALAYRVIDSQGNEVYQGRIGSTVTLPPGAYRLEISSNTAMTFATVFVESGRTTFVELRDERGALRASIVSGDDAAP